MIRKLSLLIMGRERVDIGGNQGIQEKAKPSSKEINRVVRSNESGPRVSRKGVEKTERNNETVVGLPCETRQ